MTLHVRLEVRLPSASAFTLEVSSKFLVLNLESLLRRQEAGVGVPPRTSRLQEDYLASVAGSLQFLIQLQRVKL